VHRMHIPDLIMIILPALSCVSRCSFHS